ncbi:unnamed protein product [Gongylonema pulchrum]|uniref:Peptidase S53 domain-containing protein n=1 Tax=Gongylonema pulchrum TaxID=637853 RepID=A0A183DNA9_9BILA|nr:unnamed protein product [Gongylonema pulchrum]
MIVLITITFIKVLVKLVFLAPAELQSAVDGSASGGSNAQQQPSSATAGVAPGDNVRPPGARSVRGAMRAFTLMHPTSRAPTFIAVPGVNSGGRGGHVHFPPLFAATTGGFGGHIGQVEGRNRSRPQSFTITASSHPPAGTGPAGAVDHFVRNMLQNAIGNAMPAQRGQPATGRQHDRIAGRPQNIPHGNQQGPTVRVQHPVQTPFGTHHFGSGIVGQVIVRTSGAENVEATRRAVDAAMQAASAAVGENGGVHVQLAAPRVGNAANSIYLTITKTQLVVAVIEQRCSLSANSPSEMFIGPNFPMDLPFYTNDPHLSCQSDLCNPRASIHNSSKYNELLDEIYQERIRDLGEHTLPLVLNYNGDALFTSSEVFKSVLTEVLRRAVANLAHTDSHYGMIPVLNTPIYGYDIPSPVMDRMGFHGLSDTPRANTGDEDSREPLDTTQESVTSDTQDSSSAAGESGEAAATAAATGAADSGVTDIMRAASTLMRFIQSGSSTTLAQAARQMGHQPTVMTTEKIGFVNLVMVLAYELLQISEFMQLLVGDFAFLSRHRHLIRHFVIENVFNDNCHPSDEDIANATERVALAESELDRFFAFEDVHRFVHVDGVGRVDIIGSVMRLERRVVNEFLHHLLRTDDGNAPEMLPEEYSEIIVDMFKAYVCRAVFLTNLSMNGDPCDYERLLLRFADQAATENERQLFADMSHMSITHIRLLLQREQPPVSIRDMMEDIVLTDEGADAAALNMLSSGAENESTAEPSFAEEEAGREDRTVDADVDKTQDSDGSDESGAGLPKAWSAVFKTDQNRSVAVNPSALSSAYLAGGCSTKEKGMKVPVEGSVNAVISSAITRSVEEAVSFAGFSMPDVSLPFMPEIFCLK